MTRLGPLGTASLAGLVALVALASGDLFTAAVLATCLAGYVIARAKSQVCVTHLTIRKSA